MGVLDSFRLDDKIVIVTGASSGLGVSFAQAFAEAGADVVLGARRVDRLAETAALVEATGRKVLTLATDVSVPEQCQALVDSAMQTFGRVDILINNAGVGTARPATRETPEQFRSVVDVNLNIASVLGITTADLPQAAYSASKAAIIGLTRDLAQQWGSRKGIRVNALAPGFFRTEMTDEYKPGYLDSQAHRLILGRLGDARELAATAVWLASAAGGYVTGQTIVVDGGLTIT
jgi:NAD(P)-dependent dehydrogenase (short-subunit alcohol dehydrogenase family)